MSSANRPFEHDASRTGTGFVSLVGAGPGDPELLTYRAIQRLRQADLVLFDGLVPRQIVELADQAEHVSVSKRVGSCARTQDDITALMLAGARSGKRVVRLKAGDPFVFGRGGEEMLALAEAAIPFEVVPGVSAAIAGPALAGIPVTHRGVASAFVVVSGHGTSAYGGILGTLPPASATVVVLMGLGERAGIQSRLEDGGWDPLTPAAIVFSASQPDQHVWIGTLGGLGTAEVGQREDPGVIVIGHVVSLATMSDLVHSFVREETSWQPTTIQRL